MENNNYSVYVAGGCGQVGKGVVRSLIQSGYMVYVSSRSLIRLESLKEYLDDAELKRTIFFHENIASEQGAEAIGEALAASPYPLIGAIASLGHYEEKGRLLEMSLHEFQKSLESHLIPHFMAAKTLFPLIKKTKESFYLLINGGGADIPLLNAGAISMMDAAELMMQHVLIAEYEQDPIRVNTLMIYQSVGLQVNQMNPSDIGEIVVKLIQDPSFDGQTIRLHSKESFATLTSHE